MFVSILQFLGFPATKAVHSPANENRQSLPLRAEDDATAASALAHAASGIKTQKKSARRPAVKTQSATPKAAAPVSKPATPKTKAADQAASPTPPVKPSAKAAPVKAPAKPKAPKAAPVETTPVVKATPSKASKATAPVKEKDSVKTTIAKATKPEVAVTKTKVTHSVAPGTLSKAAATSKPAVADTPASVPARAGRPSSRLAQLTVPSMAQSVASTAAKASYAQLDAAPPIIPPLASAVKKDPKLANNWKTKPVDQLTDAELMAMSDDEYMNDTQMAYFRLKLSKLKAGILSSAGETTEHLREDTVVVPDPADRATIEEEHALELRTRDRERKLLKKIEQSIVRIDAGDYGYCDETGEPIGVGRLLARPTATLSLEAQQRRELKQKMFGD